MLPASFYQYGVSSVSHPIPQHPRDLRDAAAMPSFLQGMGCPGGATVRRVGGLGALSGVGEALPSAGYAAAALAGAGLGGGLIGWVAADNLGGAYKGASFAAGLVGVADGFATFKDSKPLGTVLMLGGLAGIWWSIRGKIRR